MEKSTFKAHIDFRGSVPLREIVIFNDEKKRNEIFHASFLSVNRMLRQVIDHGHPE